MATRKSPRSSGSSSASKAMARQRAAEQRALETALAVQAERRRRMFRVFVPIAVVVVIVVALIVNTLLNRTHLKSGTPPTAADPAVVAAVTSVPTATFNAVGAGTVTVPPKVLRSSLLTDGGKPRVLYVGAEWCPFCAAERWSVAVALARFGTFTGLGQTASSPSDSYPNTATLTFHGATFTSSVLVFNGHEVQSNQVKNNAYLKLDTLDAADAKLFSSVGGSSFPFVDIGGRYAITGASYSVGVLKGKTQAQIAAALASPNSPIAKAVDGAANMITAAICASTDNVPAAVCTSAGVTTAKAKL